MTNKPEHRETLKVAIKQILLADVENGKEGTPLPVIPHALRNTFPNFSPKDFGFKKLKELLLSFPDDFSLTIKKRENGEEYTPPVFLCSIRTEVVFVPPLKKEDVKIEKNSPQIEKREKLVAEGRRLNFISGRESKVVRKGIVTTPKEKKVVTPEITPSSEKGSEIPSPRPFASNCVVVEKPQTLFRTYQGQPTKDIFGVMLWTESKNEDYNVWYERIADKAKYENWTFLNAHRKFSILHQYLLSSFSQSMEQKKVLFSEDGQYACFNTGLQTDEGKDVFLYFIRYIDRRGREDEYPKWVLHKVIDSYSKLLRSFGKEPEAPTYIDDPYDLIFNYTYDFEVNTKHIVEDNASRLPDSLRENTSLASLVIEGALKELKTLIQRDYRIPIPFWHKGKIQLLLPFMMNENSSSEFAFVVERDDVMKKYRVKTIIPVEFAYSNVRLLRRMNEDWLINAIKI